MYKYSIVAIEWHANLKLAVILIMCKNVQNLLSLQIIRFCVSFLLWECFWTDFDLLICILWLVQFNYPRVLKAWIYRILHCISGHTVRLWLGLWSSVDFYWYYSTLPFLLSLKYIQQSFLKLHFSINVCIFIIFRSTTLNDLGLCYQLCQCFVLMLNFEYKVLFSKKFSMCHWSLCHYIWKRCHAFPECRQGAILP